MSAPRGPGETLGIVYGRKQGDAAANRSPHVCHVRNERPFPSCACTAPRVTRGGSASGGSCFASVWTSTSLRVHRVLPCTRGRRWVYRKSPVHCTASVWWTPGSGGIVFRSNTGDGDVWHTVRRQPVPRPDHSGGRIGFRFTRATGVHRFSPCRCRRSRAFPSNLSVLTKPF